VSSEYSEKWCERYCSDTVDALRDALEDMDFDVDHALDYPDDTDPASEPTISHTFDPASKVDCFWWSPSTGWTYTLRGEPQVQYPMDVAVDENPGAFAVAAREVLRNHSGGAA
jgi:hypothetical protein